MLSFGAVDSEINSFFLGLYYYYSAWNNKTLLVSEYIVLHWRYCYAKNLVWVGDWNKSFRGCVRVMTEIELQIFLTVHNVYEFRRRVLVLFYGILLSL